MKIRKFLSSKTCRVIAFSILTTVILGTLTACMNAINYTYQNADKYTAGDRNISEKVDTIDIDYLSGDIVLNATTSDAIEIKETINKTVKDEMKVHTWVNDGTLYVRFCESGRGLDFTNINKKLDITIPSDMALNDLKVEISSGSFTGKAINANAVNVNASSGEIDVDCKADKIKLMASSGSIALKQKGDSSEIKLEASSGRIKADVENATNVKVATSSGNAELNGKNVKEINTNASSGDGKYTFNVVPEKSSFTASSGEITIYIPEDSDIKVTSTHSSGDFDYELPFGKDGNNFVCGGGKNTMKLTTSSGDQKIMKLKSGE